MDKRYSNSFGTFLKHLRGGNLRQATMRAKFMVQSVEPYSGGERLTFTAVTEGNFDKDGYSDDNSFARWTPQANLSMVVLNPNLLGKFKQGQKFCVDFTEAVPAGVAE